MARKAVELGPLAVSRLSTPGFHLVGGVAGLGLQVLPSGGRSWLLRAMIGARRREMGLGGFPDVTLAGAKEAARQAREKIRAGSDPIEEARAARSALKARSGKAMTFEQCALAYMAAHEASWHNDKHRQQWRNSLKTYAYPVIGRLLVSDVDQSHVMAILDPIWRTKTETAKRVRGRLEVVLDWAAGRKLRTGENPARWKGLLQTQLPSPNKIVTVKHHSAVPLSEVASFMEHLRKADGMGARALEFLVLTAARSGEVRGACWSEIDGYTWSIPAERMKAGKAHVVPLSKAALELLRSLPRMAGTGLVFPSPSNCKLSDMTLTAVMRRMGSKAVPHGWRSTFRDWAAELTNYPNHVAEMALAHTVKGVEGDYRRGNLLQKRALMMEDWAAFAERQRAVMSSKC